MGGPFQHGSGTGSRCSAFPVTSHLLEEGKIMNSTFVRLCACIALAASAGACGYSTGDRAVSGGLLGAGTGAAIGGISGGSAGTGALIGGAVGAVGGAATSGNDVNLGRPVWR